MRARAKRRRSWPKKSPACARSTAAHWKTRASWSKSPRCSSTSNTKRITRVCGSPAFRSKIECEMLRVEGISKTYGRRAVLDGVSFELRPGEITGLIGPNGAGKTTLFECVAGLLPSDRGRVFGDGKMLAPENRKDILYYVPDGIRPWPDQRLSWMAEFFEHLFARPPGEGARVLESLGLGHLTKSPMGWLSKGESKRALLAFGLLTPQPVLLLDEPFDGLDLRQMRDVMLRLQMESRGGRTLFLSVHELGHAAQVCDRLVLLSAGKTVGEGTVAELRARAGLPETSAIEEVFLALT